MNHQSFHFFFKVFILMRSVYLFLFCSWCHALGIISKNPESQKLILMFSNKNFIVLALKFRTMTHFGCGFVFFFLIFVFNCRIIALQYFVGFCPTRA